MKIGKTRGKKLRLRKVKDKYMLLCKQKLQFPFGGYFNVNMYCGMQSALKWINCWLYLSVRRS